MNTKTEIWNGHLIRFIEKEPGDWWAVAADVAKALNLDNTTKITKRIEGENQAKYTLPTTEGGNSFVNHDINIVSELGIYEMVFASRRPEAKLFRQWVYKLIRELRETSGLEAFQVFRMLDKEHQKEAMRQLRDGLFHPVRVDFIKANTIANKAISTKHGYPKMVKKDQMTPEMLLERQPILKDTVTLMEANDSFGLGLSVSESVYQKYCH